MYALHPDKISTQYSTRCMSYSSAIGGTPQNVSAHYLLMTLTTSATSFQSVAMT